MRVVAVHADVIVFISSIWQTTATAVRAGDEGFLIDSPVYPAELEALPGVLDQAGFPVSGLLVTHADWDHLLSRLAFPGTSLGCGERTAERLAAELGGAQRRLRAFDEEHYVAGRRALGLAGVQSLPEPGRLGLGPDHELELHPAGGHTADGTAYWLPWLRVLVCGDFLSPVEIPMISVGGSREAYLATLARLQPLVELAEVVIPGHGTPLTRGDAGRILQEDTGYLTALAGDVVAAPLPTGRATPSQRRIHEENVKRTAG